MQMNNAEPSCLYVCDDKSPMFLSWQSYLICSPVFGTEKPDTRSTTSRGKS
jgi:hypothetical protein